tara:strand:+ start:1957 stop:2292 length:336 start_codon:yes stop_codon:yes gene_type:complete
MTQWHGGKGDLRRGSTYGSKFGDNYDKIWGKKEATFEKTKTVEKTDDLRPIDGRLAEAEDCLCNECIKDNKLIDKSGFLLSVGNVVVCSECGSKRCVHAENHNNKCSGWSL